VNGYIVLARGDIEKKERKEQDQAMGDIPQEMRKKSESTSGEKGDEGGKNFKKWLRVLTQLEEEHRSTRIDLGKGESRVRRRNYAISDRRLNRTCDQETYGENPLSLSRN